MRRDAAPPGGSTRTTSAPRSPSRRPHSSALSVAMSSTRMPARGRSSDSGDGPACASEAHGKVLDTSDEVRPQPDGLAGALHPGHPPGQLLEEQPDLHAGQVGSQAVVRSAAAEGDVVVRAAIDVESERVV